MGVRTQSRGGWIRCRWRPSRRRERTRSALTAMGSRANLGVLNDVALLRELADTPSQVEETDLEEGNAPISIP